MADNAIVQLGFALPINTDGDDKLDEESIPLCHQSPYWSNWDGGKIGGKPSWLNPRDIPSIVRCRGCSSSSKDDGSIMQFVAQLYCPADDVTNNDDAFHRSLYVFACSKCCNSSTTSTDTAEKEGNTSVSTNSSTSNKLSNCIRVLRCQLPKQNDFYPSTGNEPEEDDEEEWTKHTSQYWATATNNDKLNLCTVCGQVSKGKCPKQQLWFCGPQHQKECLRLSNQSKGDNTQSGSTKYSSVCYESELVVEEEPVEEKNTTKSSNDTATTSATDDNTNEATLFQTKDITDSDANLEQSDLNALTGNVSISQAASTMGVTDPVTLEFYARMSIGGEENDVRDQVLRYNRWPDMNKKEKNGGDGDEEDDNNNVGPLWLSSDNRPPTVQSSTEESFPPPCQYCGAPRSFEFQILPQMLHYLLQDPNSSNDDDEQPRQVLTESKRAVLLEAQTKIESGVDLPEGFKEQHEKVLANARESLLSGSSSSKKNGSINQDGEEMLDWGTIAVYTCTASCGGGEIVTGNEENGAYLEEVAWMQPPLD